MGKRKEYVVHVFDQDGTAPLGTLTTQRPESTSAPFLKNPVTFNSQINGGQGQCILDVFSPFDSFDETLINFMNVASIDAVVIDEDAKTQLVTQIYKGFMSQIEVYAEGGDQGVRITLLGLVSLLTRSYYKSGSDFAVTHTTEDPTVIGKAVITHFNTIYGGSLLSYDASSVPATVGTTATVTFTDQKWFAALVNVGELSGTGWWWRIGSDGKYYLQAKPSTPTHRLTIGKDIVNFSCIKDSEQVINDVQVRRAGGTTSDYSDASSQSTYGTGSPATGKYSKIISDTGLGSANAADLRGQKEIADNKDAKISSSVVLNSQYAIESIQPGDTCSINNLSLSSTFFGTNNLLIVSTNYAGDTLTLELEKIISFGTELDRFVNN